MVSVEFNFKNIQNNISIGLDNLLDFSDQLLVIDRNMNIIDANYSFTSLMGLEKEDIVGKKCFEIIPNHHCHTKTCVLSQKLNGADIWDKKRASWNKYISDQGSTMKAIPFYDSQGEFVGIIENFSDLSHKINIEENNIKTKVREYKQINILKAVPDIFLVIDKESIILDYHSKSGNFYFPPELFLGKKIVDIFPPPIVQDHIQCVNKVLETKEPQTMEYMLPIDNESRYFEARHLYSSDTVIYIFIRDISERKISKIKLKQSERRYRILFDTSPNGIGLETKNGKIVAMNKTMEKILGYRIEEINKVGIGVTYANPLERIDLLDQIEREGKVLDFEIKLRKKNGEKFYALINIEEVESNFENLLLTTISDISKSKKAEEQLKLTQFSVDSAYIGIYWFDQHGKFFYVNDAACRDLEYSKDELLSLTISDIAPDILRKKWKPFWEDLVQRKKITIETNFRVKSGKLIPVEINGTYLEYNGRGYCLALSPVKIERKKALDTIKENQKFLSDVFNSIQDGIYVINRDFEIIHANPTLKKWFGIDVPVLDRKCHDLFHCRDDLCSYCDANEVFESLSPTIKVVPKIDGNGQITGTLEINSYPFLDQKTKEVKGIIKIARDITQKIKIVQEQKIAEQKLKTSEEKYRLISENVNDLIFVMDKNQRYEYINEKTTKRVLGYTREDMIGYQVVKFLHPEDLKGVLKKFKKGWEIGKGKAEIRFKKNDGDYIWVSIFGRTFIGTDKKKKAIFTARDITKQKKTQQQLRESEEKYRTLVETSPNGIILADLKGMILECNIESEKILNLNKSELIGKPFLEMIRIAEGDNLLLINQILKMVKEKSFTPFEFKFWPKNMDQLWLKNQISIIKIEGKEYFQIILENISDRKTKEELAEKTIKSLTSLDKIKNQFLLRVSHELKTPLTSIYTASSLLLESYVDKFDEKTLNLLRIINNGGARLSELVKNLIDLIQIENYQMELKFIQSDVRKLVDDVITDLEGFYFDRNIQTLNDIPNGLKINVDPIRIKQVISNIISNALKNTPSNGHLSIKLIKSGNYFKIIFKDDGIGFTEEEIGKLFEKFGKIERYGKGFDIITEGSGLGLYLSRKILELHNGDIFLKSGGRNLGTEVEIIIPNQEL